MTQPVARDGLPVPTTWVRGAVGVFITFAIVEFFTRLEIVNPDYLPPASSLLGETFGLLGDGEFWSAFRETIGAAGYGLIRAIVIAVPLGLLLGLSKWAYRGAITVIELLRPVPSFALIPLVILTLGNGISGKAFLVTYACIWPLLFNTIYGMRDLDDVGKDTAKAFGLGPIASALRVSLPAASPFIFTGIKIASSVALILAIGAEIAAGGSDGLGIKISEARLIGNTTLAYAYTAMTGVIGVVLYIVLEILERRLFRWNQFERADR